MEFLCDLIKDWSTRVWVISEYHIAKTKNNLKYWFIALSSDELWRSSFFKFDFTNPAFSSAIKDITYSYLTLIHNPNTPVHLCFHDLIIDQLTTKTFLEMILNSKASKNEDRFYAVLPLSKYKDKVDQVADWKINTMTSVKLKLYEIMDTKDKLLLLFSGGQWRSMKICEGLPTFATSLITGFPIDTLGYPCNFDLTNECTIQLRQDAAHAPPLHYLHLSPAEYYVKRKPYKDQNASALYGLKQIIGSLLQLDACRSTVDIVYINYFPEKIREPSTFEESKKDLNTPDYSIDLIGSFKENKWIVGNGFILSAFGRSVCDYYENSDHDIFFNIY
ncbi:hypothetical protein BCR42DRAFT_426070 [Absidia repens]|uniref:Heterokaryon incompatibility domain-containing protein n=1 Tax=Absidia repens TaxID=90262 RepID=A0A1X2I1P0_9FUNG|nr:hypothetical protein BCR42DRAFT_426070 [Absidia repens]